MDRSYISRCRVNFCFHMRILCLYPSLAFLTLCTITASSALHTRPAQERSPCSHAETLFGNSRDKYIYCERSFTVVVGQFDSIRTGSKLAKFSSSTLRSATNPPRQQRKAPIGTMHAAATLAAVVAAAASAQAFAGTYPVVAWSRTR